MKLSKYKSITIASACTVVYGFGVMTSPVFSQTPEASLVSEKISTELSSVIGQPDADEALVDNISQVESQLREYGLSEFAPRDNDPLEIYELKQERLSAIRQLRSRLKSLAADERTEFVNKIRARRAQARQELFENRRARWQERREQIEAKRQQLEERRELFKQNLEKRMEEARNRQLSAEEKLQLRIESAQERRAEAETRSEVEKSFSERDKARRRERVKGAIDSRPENIFERIGYWIASF